jgi:hypothetical protein
MSNKAKFLVAAALVMTTAGCVESMDASYAAPSYGYGYGEGTYSNGYYPSQAYYAPPVVYSQTRYVPVPTPVAVPVHQADRGNDHRWDNHAAQRHDEPQHVEHQPSPPPAPAHNSGSSSGNHNDGNHHDASRDRNSDHHG